MDPKKHQSQQRGTPDNQPGERAPNAEDFSLMFQLHHIASSYRHHSHQSQIHQTNSDGSYTGGSPIGASKGYGQPNQQPGERVGAVTRVDCANWST